MSACRHCSIETDADDGFCCIGCRAAFALVKDAGLSRSNDLFDGAPPRGGVPQPRPWLDATGAHDVVVDVQGITCGACVWVIEKLATRHQLACQVNPGVGRLDVSASDDEAAVNAFLDDVETLGYRVGPPNKQGDAQSDTLVLRAGLSAAAAMMAMSFAFSRYFGLGTAAGDDVWSRGFLVGEFFCATFALAAGGSFFIQSALGALRLRVVAFDVPIALGIVTAYAGSIVSVVVGNDNGVFFDSVTMFIALMIGGRLAQRSVLAQSRAQLLDDTGLSGLRVVILKDQVPVASTAADVHAGDTLLIRPGDAVPVDADVVEGAASFSLAWITGEADPRNFGPGERVPAGACHAAGGAVVVKAAEEGTASRITRLLGAKSDDAVSHAGGWSRFAEASVVFVIAAAVIAGVVQGLAHGASVGVAVATAVLVVTCPCAFGLALPLVDELALASLRRRGVYVRRAGFFERLRRVRAVMLDKTGTVTLANLVVSPSSVQALRGLDATRADALFQLVARSSHPKSQALAKVLPQRALQSGVVVDEEIGRGLRATVSGLRYSLLQRGETLAFAVDEGSGDVVVAEFSFDEELQRDAAREVAALRARGLHLSLASGDREERARAIGDRLGVDAVHAGLSPDDKAALVDAVTAERGKDSVLFVGDGVNDAAAFARAGVAGTPALDRPQLPARADFYTVGGGLGPLSAIVDAGAAWSKASTAVVIAAVAYNGTAIVAAAFGLLTPLLCAVLMPASSVAVVLLARLVWSSSTKQPEPTTKNASTTTLTLSEAT